jgi:2-haloacid dehalogenase
MRRFAGIVFDAYGTLLDTASVADACERRFPGRGAHLTSLWRVRQLEYSWLRSLMGRYVDFWQITAEALDYACAALGLTLAPAVREELLRGYLTLRPFPEAPQALAQLQGQRRMVLSNGTPAMLEAGLAHAGLLPHLEAVLSVAPLGVYKPAPEVYAMATVHLGCAPTEVLFVSANGWDIAGAAAYGLTTCWLNRGNAPFEHLGALPAYTERDLTGVAALCR